MNNGFQVKSGEHKPNQQALMSLIYSINRLWLNLALEIKQACFKIQNLESFDQSLAKWVESSPMVRETCVQSQVTSYQRL